jgi:hypothetical protein
VIDSLSVFKDENLFAKIVEFAINPPIVVLNEKKPIDASFREVADFKMSEVQKDTMKALVEDDNKVEGLRGGELIIIENKNTPVVEPQQKVLVQQPSFKEQTVIKPKDGPIDVKFNMFDYSFLETEALPFPGGKVGGGGTSPQGGYTKPISVRMKLPSEPDPIVKTKINSMETSRMIAEMNMCNNAKTELKLITEITILELKNSLEKELFPFSVVSENELTGIKNIITKNLPSQTLKDTARFLQIDNEKIKFPAYNNTDIAGLNKEIYSRILDLFSDSQETILNQDNPYDTVNQAIPVKLLPNIRVNEKTNNIIEKKISGAINFNFDKCLEMAKKFPNLDLNCNQSKKDYADITSYLKSSFLELLPPRGGSAGSPAAGRPSRPGPAPGGAAGDADLINVKFSSADDSYPTIEKLISQMMTRRDLAEKFLRLKILELESHLQKAENEMVQDTLHIELRRMMDKYGPAIEGLQEHIKNNY